VTSRRLLCATISNENHKSEKNQDYILDKSGS
jgi:hypothetical protein